MNWVRLMATLGILLGGCTDKAKPDYATCVQARASGDIEGAWRACNDAIRADPSSTSGKAAATLLAEVKPDYDRRKAEHDAAQAKAAEEQRKVDADARARALVLAKQKVEAKFWDTDRDGECAGKGLPPYRKSYEGGTFQEDRLVAAADGCTSLFPDSNEPQLVTIFCCPR